nr:hypothetical protein [Tanacetum cinerariifolium]
IVQGAHVAIPLVSIKEVSSHFANTIYGYSIGRNTNARALIEVPSETALMDSLVVAIPFQNRPGHKLEMIDIEYEWKLSHFDTDKDVSDLQEINVVSLQNLFDALMEKAKIFEVNNETWKASNDVGSIMDDSDSEEVKNIFVEYNGKHVDDLVDDARKKVEAPPKKIPKKTGIWSGRKADSFKRNLVFSHETTFHYFDRDDYMGHATKIVEHENSY